MEKKDEKAKTVAMPKTAEPKNETATPKADEPKKAEKKLSLSEILDAQLKEIQRKKRLADNRSLFLEKLNDLAECERLLNEEVASGNFSTDNFVLRFGKRKAYSGDEEKFNISNPDVLVKFIKILQAEILSRIERIEKELLQDIA